MQRSGRDIEKLLFVVEEISEGRGLNAKYKDHKLKGNYIKKRDCHIETDWI